ncbi:hypothetical protein Syun_030784 [Stephania yunnanensis]|uniref:Uncharacterized protein n=1 Tax=Stephania yunnanensis TaxID=152371 RepID=A0AAP0DUR1_9MAGN
MAIPFISLPWNLVFVSVDSALKYIDFCRKREVLPIDAFVSSFSKAKLQKSCFERSILQVLLDLLMDVDVPPLIETFSLMRYDDDLVGRKSDKKEDHLGELMKRFELGKVPDDEIRRLIRVQLDKRIRWGDSRSFEQQIADVLM